MKLVSEFLAKIVDGSKDFVAVRARAPFDFCTSLSCLESNGQMHTFLVAYRKHPERLEVDTRGLQYEKAVFPRAVYGLGVVAPDSVGKLVFTFDKTALVKGQVFRVYFYEKGGARNLVVTMNGKDVNGARRL